MPLLLYWLVAVHSPFYDEGIPCLGYYDHCDDASPPHDDFWFWPFPPPVQEDEEIEVPDLPGQEDPLES